MLRRKLWTKIYDALDPPPALTVSQWAERYRVVSRGWSRNYGPWKNARSPHLVGVMDAFSSPHVRKISICKSSQMGGTEAMLNMLGYAIWGDPGPAMWVYPAHDDAKRLLLRVKSMSENTRAIREERSKERYRESVVGCHFRNMSLWFASSKTPRSLAQLPCRYVFFDEVDKYDRWSGVESDPVSLGEQRTQTYVGIEKVILNSTPTTEDGYIAQSLNDSHQLRDFVPCPKCGMYQEFVWSQVKYDDDDPSNARYECIECDFALGDKERWAAVNDGVWMPNESEPTKDPEPDPLTAPHVGFHFWRMYSKVHEIDKLVEKFLEARNIPERMMSFSNNVLAEPHVEVITSPDASKIVGVGIDEYRLGQIPKEVQLVTVGVDVGKRTFPYVIRGWGHYGSSWLINYGTIEFEAHQLEWGTLIDRTFARFERMDGAPIQATFVMIDSGYKAGRENEVYKFALKYPERVRATKGDAALAQPWAPRPQKNVGVILWKIKVEYYKDMLFGRLLKPTSEDGSLHWPVDVGDDYFYQLCSERKEQHVAKKTGKLSFIWKKKKGVSRNHYLDCEVLNFAAGDILNVSTLEPKMVGPKVSVVDREELAEKGLDEWEGRANRDSFDISGLDPLQW